MPVVRTFLLLELDVLGFVVAVIVAQLIYNKTWQESPICHATQPVGRVNFDLQSGSKILYTLTEVLSERHGKV